MSVDLGAVIARVVLEDVGFQASIRRNQALLRDFGTSASKTAAGTAELDGSLAAVGASASKTGASLGRAAKASTDMSAAEQKAAVAAARHASAVSEVSAALTRSASAGERVQVQTLRQVAAQQRLTAASGEAGSAEALQARETARLAAAQASAISATTALATAQKQGAASAGLFAGRMGGLLKTAGELGLVFGAFELVKKSIDITKEANEFQRSMVQVQTNADVSATEVHKASAALLAMAGPVAAAPAELATAWYHAKSVGLDYAKSIEVTRIAAEGARVGHADLEQTMNALTSTVASGIPGVEDMSAAMGQLITIVGSGDMKLSDLNEALGTGVLVRMKQYGLSLRDVGAALATFGDNNIRGADAATLLRMSVEAMAKQGKPGVAALASIGIKANQLRDDLQSGGLNKAVLDLNAHLKAAGITGNKVGGFLIDAFTKKGGGGVAVLLGQLDRLESKFAILKSSGASFGDKWNATTQTASFALARLGHMAEAAGIELTAKLGPSIAAIARWFGQEIPVAVHAAVSVLGGPLAAAWAAVSTGVSLVGDVLGPVLHLIDSMSGLLGVAATGALALWAAFKGVAIAHTALLGLVNLINRAGIGFEAFRAAGGLAAGGILAAAAAVGVLGFQIAGVLDKGFERHIKDWTDGVSGMAQAHDTLRDALVASNGALTDSIRLSVSKQIQDEGIAAAAQKAGISLTDLTGAVLGGKPALDALVAKWQASGVALDSNGVKLLELQLGYVGAANQAKALRAVMPPLTDAIDKAAAATKIAGDTAKRYATMAGLVVDKDGNVAASQAQVNAAIAGVAKAYNTATQAGSTYLAALDTFSKSAGTSADRAAFIGATLVAANGDALSYASAINGAATANRNLVTSLRQQASQVGKSGISIRDLMRRVVDLNTGTINYARAGAGPLIQGLQGIQSAAMQAAQATYQHARSTETGKRAADDAYRVYVNQTRGSLIDEATQLGLTHAQAKKLADQYFGMPKDVKTQIEAAGANPVLDVLNRIGRLLANLTGQQWDINVATHYTQTGAPPRNLGSSGNSGSSRPVSAASGGAIHGPGTGTSDSIPARLSNGEHVWTAAEVRKAGGHGAMYAMRAAAAAGNRVRGFAAGGGVTTGTVDGKKVWRFGGQEYKSQTAADNAQARAQTKLGKLLGEIASKDIPGFIGALSKSTAELITAERTLSKAAREAGLTHKALARVAAAEGHLNALSRARNKVAGQLGAPTSTAQTAWQALEAARSNYQGEKSNVSGTITGGFDLAQAGRSSGTSVTLASILGDASQQRANAALFNQQLDKLKSMGLGKTELQQLAEKGFAGAESSTLALLGASRKQIGQLNSNVAGLGTAAGKTGTFAADLLYGKDVQNAQGRVNRLTDQEHRIDARMERIMTRVVHEIGQGLHIQMPKELVLIDEHGVISGKMRVAQRKLAHEIHWQAGRP